MVVIELVVMRGMYHDARVNVILIRASVAIGVLMFVLIRQQAIVTDRQWLQ